LEKEKSQLTTQFNNLKELNSNSSSEEIIHLKANIEELQLMLKNLNERLKNKNLTETETSNNLINEPYTQASQKTIYKELESNYLKTKQENKDLKLQIAKLNS